MVSLGVGKNMVRSIRCWFPAAEPLEEVRGTRSGSLELTD
jgi:hypothetical protein